MSSPFHHHDMASPRMSAPPGDDQVDGSEADIPKRMMRVKVLYTFDDSNKTNCLARLPNALSIPVIPLDESTQIGVVELKICIQAIVASSPELLAKLEHDYTVYAYDFSEYETPIVGQGMLSWVLASASPTPAAPASQSKTMITGRVCKNILGLFSSNGIKETLEVKLKLVPVPTCSKNEFLQNMAVYRNPNVVMPEGFDNHAWNSFLQAIPNAGIMEEQPQMMGQMSQMSQGGQGNAGRQGMGGMDHLHDMLTPNFGPDDDTFSTHMSLHGSRNGSPTPSHLSAGQQHAAAVYNQSRPGSRMSMQQQQNDSAFGDQGFDEGHARKRARLTQADWNGRGSFGANADSLRVAVSTSASLRGFRPSAIGNTSAGGDMMPRAPTPRPGEKRQGRGSRPPLMSNLRRESSTSTYVTPYPTSDAGYPRTDSGIYSPGDDEASSRFGSPSPDIPSSPPEYTPIESSMPPSSPGLPELPYNDSGFQSDVTMDQSQRHGNSYDPKNMHGNRHGGNQLEWSQVNPDAQTRMPLQSFEHFDPLAQKSARAVASSPTKSRNRGGRTLSRHGPTGAWAQHPNAQMPIDAPSPGVLASMETTNFAHPSVAPRIPPQSGQKTPAFSPPEQQHGQPIAPALVRAATEPQGQTATQPIIINTTGPPACSTGPSAKNIVLPKRKPDSRQGQSKGRGRNATMVARSHSWAAAPSSDIDSDTGNLSASGVAAPKRPRARGGSSMVRVNSINNLLEQSVAAGLPVRHCINCGEIKTPTWRPYWTQVQGGDGKHLNVSSKSGIHMVEPLTKGDNGETTRYRLYKQYSHLTPEEKKGNAYEQFIFCNPCGDFVRKHGKVRPAELWDPELKRQQELIPKEKKPRRKKNKASDLTSDLPVPSSDWDIQPSSTLPFANLPDFTDPFGPSEGFFQSEGPAYAAPTSRGSKSGPLQARSTKVPTSQPAQQSNSQSNNTDGNACTDNTTLAALQHAIQSSPARALGAAVTPIEIQDEESPKPTRRMLFPSPRKTGEFKSLDDSASQKSNTSSPSGQPVTAPEAITTTGPTPAQELHKPDLNMPEPEQVNKENLPPLEEDDDDEFAHLFDDTIIPGTPGKLTPSTARTIQNLLRTPTPLRSRQPFHTPGTKRSSDHLTSPTPPSKRSRLSPTTSNILKPMTPFSGALNQFLSDGMTSSPSKAFNWGLTSSPHRSHGHHSGFGGFTNEEIDIFSSDFPPMPSSPPMLGHSIGDLGDLGFELFEDATATDPMTGGWDSDFFGGGSGDGGVDHEPEKEGVASKSSTQGSRIDFGAVLEGGANATSIASTVTTAAAS